MFQTHIYLCICRQVKFRYTIFSIVTAYYCHIFGNLCIRQILIFIADFSVFHPLTQSGINDKHYTCNHCNPFDQSHPWANFVPKWTQRRDYMIQSSFFLYDSSMTFVNQQIWFKVTAYRFPKGTRQMKHKPDWVKGGKDMLRKVISDGQTDEQTKYDSSHAKWGLKESCRSPISET